uniref:Ig-like domain-containing protein n=1 Tax=Balaenoptera musculus TaxID=9771 RepID=A0A8C0HVU6_BALMU
MAHSFPAKNGHRDFHLFSLIALGYSRVGNDKQLYCTLSRSLTPILVLREGCARICLGNIVLFFSICSADHVVGISGESVWLRPPSIQIRTYSVKWKMQPYSNSSCFLIHSWKNVSSRSDVGKSLNWTPNHFNNRLSFISENLTLLIMAVQQQDSGLYFLEVTEDTGKVWRHKFQVSVFDRVEKPQLVERWKVLDRGMCQVTLSCSVSRGGDVSYAWYKGTELIQTPRNLTKLEEQIDVSGLHTYTCNVSNPVSWANHTLQLTQGCLNAHPSFIFLSILVSIVILLTALFLGTLTCFCVRRWKRKQSQTRPEEFLTIYEDVNNVQTRRNQVWHPRGCGLSQLVWEMLLGG